LPAPATLTRIDNPAGCNLKFRIGSNELWFTLHDTSNEALLARLRTTLPLLQDIVEACKQRYEQRKAAVEQPQPTSPSPEPAPELTLQEQIAAAVAAAMKAQTAASSNGASKPASPEAQAKLNAAKHDNDPSWCHKHQVTMQWHDGNARAGLV
jgi:hypothetical protein